MLSIESRRFGPFYQSRLVDLSIMLSPSKPEMGAKGFFWVLTNHIQVGRNFLPDFFVLTLRVLMMVASILLQRQITYFTPRVKAKRACSWVCPSLEITTSKPLVVESMIRTTQLSWEIPVIMFLIKSRCPGASMIYSSTWWFQISTKQY